MKGELVVQINSQFSINGPIKVSIVNVGRMGEIPLIPGTNLHTEERLRLILDGKSEHKPIFKKALNKLLMYKLLEKRL